MHVLVLRETSTRQITEVMKSGYFNLFAKQVCPRKRHCWVVASRFRFMNYKFDNFFVGTFADFELCERPTTSPDFYSFSGSTYWDLGDKVIRWSTHWGPNISSCHWYLDGKIFELGDSCLAGICLYKDFKSIEFHTEWVWRDYWEC